MNIRIDGDLAKRAAILARHNGISVAKYVNGLVESALKGEVARAKAQALDEKRREVVDRLWERHKFPKNIKVAAFNGWECEGGADGDATFRRVFFYVENDEAGPTKKGVFRADFEGTRTRPSEFGAYDETYKEI